MKRINILFLGGAKRVSLAERFIRAGSKNNAEVRIFSYELQEKVPIACLARVIVGLKWKDKQILEHLGQVIAENRIDIVLPFVDPAIEICSRLKQQTDKSVYIPVSNEALCQTMFEKKQAAAWFSERGFPIPETYSLHNIKFPAILKPNTGSAAKGLIVVHDNSELNNISRPEDYLIQEYIGDNTEYTVDAFVSEKREIMAAVPRIRLETAGGESVRSVTIRENEIIELSHKILQSDEFYGPITIQFIRDNRKHKLYVMEINPRLGGGVVLSIEAGADICEMIIGEHLGLHLEKCTNWTTGLLMTRYFKEVFYADNH